MSFLNVLRKSVAYQGFFGGLTNPVKDRGKRERDMGAAAPYLGILEGAVIWYKKFHNIF